MNSVSPWWVPPVEEVLAFLGLRDRLGDSFLVNKRQDGGQQGVGEAAWPPCGFDGSILVLLGGGRRGKNSIRQLRKRDEQATNGSRGDAARHYRAPKHTSCIIPPMLLCFLRPTFIHRGISPRCFFFHSLSRLSNPILRLFLLVQ